MDNQLIPLLLLIVGGCILYLLLTRQPPGAPPPAPHPPDVAERIAELQREAERLRGIIAQGTHTVAVAPVQPNTPTLQDVLKVWNGPTVKAGEWEAPPEPLPQRIHEAIAETIRGLGDVAARTDPLLTINQSHLVSIIHSAISRHGHLIEKALHEALLDYERFASWLGEKFEVGSNGSARTIDVDLIVFDKQENVIRSYEIKRGFGESLGSYTERQTRSNIPEIEARLISFAKKHGYTATSAHAHVISYYGRSMLPNGGGPTLNEHVLDEHFGNIPMRKAVENMTAEYKSQVHQIIQREGLWTYDDVIPPIHPAAPTSPAVH